MLHELLLALQGCSGNIVSVEGAVSVNRVAFISALEEQVLVQVCQLGVEYLRLENTLAQRQALPGVYLQAVCQETLSLLDDYRSALLAIEEEYLQERVFTLVSLKYRLSKYYSLLPEMNRFFRSAVQGMAVLDTVLLRAQEGDQATQDFFSLLGRRCLGVLRKQIGDILFHGKVCPELFLQKVIANQQLDRYDLVVSLIPDKLLSLSSAAKLQFVTNSAQLLIRHQDYHRHLGRLQELLDALHSLDRYTLESVLDRLKLFYSEQTLLFLKENIQFLDIMAHLQQLFLINDGEFYQQFIEETQPLMQLAPLGSRSETELNDIHLANTLIQLARPSDKLNFSFRLLRAGFCLEPMEGQKELIRWGPVSEQKGYLRLEGKTGQSAFVMHPLAQQLDQGFEMALLFRLKRNHQSAANIVQTGPTGFSLVLTGQPKEEVQSVQCVEQLTHFVSISLLHNEDAKQSVLQVHVLPKDTPNAKKALLLEQPLQADFSEEDQHDLKVSSHQDRVQIFLDDVAVASLTLSLDKLLSLWCGKGSLLLSHPQDSTRCMTDLFSFRFSPSNFFNKADPWNELSLVYSPPFPANMLIDPLVLEKFNTYFRFLFPLRKTQIGLQHLWLKMKKDEQHLFAYSRLSRPFSPELRIRHQFAYFLDCLLAYFVEDLIQTQWRRLQEKYHRIEDYEQLKTLLDYYILSLQRGMFLHRTDITVIIFDIVKLAKDFMNLVQHADRDDLDYQVTVKGLGDRLTGLLRHFVTVVQVMSKYSGQEGVFFLLERLNYEFE